MTLTIVEAANSLVPARAAWLYRREGFSVIPCKGKQPNNIRWSVFQRYVPTPNQLLMWERQFLFQNVGIICGQVSGGLVVIDLDGENAVQVFERRWPQLTDTFTVQSGSGKGKHLYFYAVRPIATTKVMELPNGGNIELRSNGQLIIAPPSIHPETGKRYRIDKPLPIKRIDLYPCREWILGLERQKYGERMTHWKKGDVQSKAEKRAMSLGYAVTALQQECSAVVHSTDGNRNNRLNVAAYSLGQLVGDNLIPRWQVEDDLIAAAAACGLPEAESLRTIKSGIEAGMKNPRSRRYG